MCVHDTPTGFPTIVATGDFLPPTAEQRDGRYNPYSMRRRAFLCTRPHSETGHGAMMPYMVDLKELEPFLQDGDLRECFVTRIRGGHDVIIL